MGGIPAVVASIVVSLVWRTVARRHRDSRITREHFAHFELAWQREEAAARHRPAPPPGAIVFPSGDWLPSPDPDSLDALAVRTLCGDKHAASRYLELTEDERAGTATDFLALR
jgi:hypothetical protein